MARNARKNRRIVRPSYRLDSLEERILLSSTLSLLAVDAISARLRSGDGGGVGLNFPLLHEPIIAEPVHPQPISTNPIVAQPISHEPISPPGVAYPIAITAKISPNDSSPPGGALIPSQIAQAYGINQITFGSISGNGAGQTIAIIDAYDDPNAAADLHTFDVQFGLPDPPSFQKLNQSGQTSNYPITDPASGSGNTWEVEESLDIEWAHAVAPMASIDLVEANSASYSNLIGAAVNTARNLPGVDVVSMSFGGTEFSGETAYDATFTTPLGHPGVTFLSSTGDSGVPAGYPSYSPNVIAVGGTTLYLNGSTYSSESAWGSGGGGISVYESQPSYQKGVVTQSTTKRTAPDVSIDADPSSGVAIYDSYDFGTAGWISVGGTSMAAPMWAGLIAITDQGRQLASLPSLDGPTQALPALYKLPAADFHDVTTGSNGYSAGPGYDLATGIGTPIANLLVPALAGVGSISGTVFQDNNGDGVFDAGDTPVSGATVYIDSNNNGVLDPTTTTTYNSTGSAKAIPDNNTNGVSWAIAVPASTVPITNVNVTLNITHTKDSNLTAYLIGPDGTTVALFEQVSATGANFTSTTFSSSATTSIANGAAPFTGSYLPSPGQLSSFNGKLQAGNWTLKVIDSVKNNTGSINSWSIAITTGETSVATNASGNYIFNSVPVGSYNVREVVPANNIQIGPQPGASPAAADAFMLASNSITGENFSLFPTVFNVVGSTASYYLMLDPTGANLEIFNAANNTGGPNYEVPIAYLPALTFNLQAASTVLVDYTNGDPIPASGISLNAPVGSSDTLEIIGQTPAQQFTMTDTQIGPTGGPIVAYQNFDTLSILDATVNYGGNFGTLNNLDIGQDATFIWS
jgi:subtilisin-like proprotein convertase family protein